MTKKELQDLIWYLLDLIYAGKRSNEELRDSKVVWIAKREVTYQ
jgi:hypothetical protein